MLLDLQGSYNIRDIGGYPTTDGYVTRYKTILRGDSPDRLSRSGYQALFDYGVRSIIDVRWTGEIQRQPGAVEDIGFVYLHAPFHGEKNPYDLLLPTMTEMYIHYLEQEKVYIRFILEALLKPHMLPALIHCTAGKDRTGLIVALLLGVAHVPREIIVDDYIQSAVHLVPFVAELAQIASKEDIERYAYLLECKPDFMAETLTYIDQQHGGVKGYLRYIGLDDYQCQRLREMIVDYTVL